jgi:hypothetical protein
MIITADKSVVHNWKPAAAFVLFSLNSWNVHRLFSDAWWSGAVKYRWSPGAVGFWMYCCRFCYLHVPIVLKSGRLSFLETTGSVKVMGLLYLLLLQITATLQRAPLINTNKDDTVRALMSDDSAYWGNCIRNNQRHEGASVNLTIWRAGHANNLASLQTDIV